MSVVILVAASSLFVAGLALAVSPEPDHARPRRRPASPETVRRVVAACGLGVVVVVVSGWVLPAVALSVGAWLALHGWERRTRAVADELARVEALASWIENLRDVLAAGEQPVGAVTSTVRTCPPAIRPQVRRLAAGLGRQDPDLVMRRFADELDDPLGDLVAAGLLIAIRRGARTVGVLTSLAQQARQQADRRRLVEAERAPTRREVTSLVAIMGALLVALFLLGRSEYLAAYDRPAGQAFLVVALGAYAALVARVQRLATFPKPSRFITVDRGAR
ncbi:MAG TPA: hypothetical protein VGK49_05730 [Ilumatobacteraceae bacterium]